MLTIDLFLLKIITIRKRTKWVMSICIKCMKKQLLTYILLLYFRFFYIVVAYWDSNIVTILYIGGQKKWTFLFQQPIFFKDYHQYIFLCWTCAFTNRKALCGTPNWKAMCLQTWQVQTVDFWCGKVAEKPSIY